MASRPVIMSCAERAERHRRVVAAYVAGARPDELAREVGLSPRRIRYIAHLYGVSRPRGRVAS